MIIMHAHQIIVMECVYILQYQVVNIVHQFLNVLIQITPQLRVVQMVNVFILKRLHVELVIITVQLDVLTLMIMIAQLSVEMEN